MDATDFGESISGSIERSGPGRLEGWCWCAARPAERLSVEILLDDVPVATVVAAHFRRDLAKAWVGDGRHAFVVLAEDHGLDPGRLDTATLIELREEATGQTVARLRQRPAQETTQERDVLAQLQQQLAPIQRAATAAVPRAPASQLRAAFAGLGDRLAARATLPFDAAARHGHRVALAPLAPAPPARDTQIEAIGAAAEQLTRRFSPFHLPILGAPALSLVVSAGEVELTWRGLADLAPGLEAIGGEILLVDPGTDPLTPLLGTIVGNLTLLPATGGWATTGNAAAAASRGDVLVWLDPDAAIRRTAPAALSTAVRAASGAVLLGARTRAAAVRLGVLDLLCPQDVVAQTPTPPDDAAAALLLAIGRTLFHRLGGLDTELGREPAVCALDLALKARLLGHRVVAWPVARFAFVPCDPIAAEVASRFAARWRGRRLPPDVSAGAQ